MDLYLQHVRTGTTTELPPERALIGAADHADVGAGGPGPYLGALAVRYVGGWALYCLCDDGVTFNRRRLHAGERVNPGPGDVLGVGDERYTVLTAGEADDTPPPDEGPPACFAYVTNPDGMEECRAVDHNLLFGRLPFCHVQLADTRLSRVSALLAAEGDGWYVHNLSKKPLGRNRKAVHTCARVADGDELLIGPLVVRLEMRPNTAERASLAPSLSGSRERPPVSAAAATDLPEPTDTPLPRDPGSDLDRDALRAAAQQLDGWLRKQPLPPAPPKSSLGGWLGAQRDRLKRFWLDTPETTAARSLRTAGRAAEAFAVLDKAIRARPDGPGLFRELYRLYEAVGMIDLCYRPLRQIEKLAEARGTPDPWVLETLARVCEQLGREQPEMYDRAVAYWTKLEATTGASYLRQRSDVMARRALRDGGFANSEE